MPDFKCEISLCVCPTHLLEPTCDHYRENTAKKLCDYSENFEAELRLCMYKEPGKPTLREVKTIINNS